MTYSETKIRENLPRLPSQGNIDLTYRCNNNCRHCWLYVPSSAQERGRELSFEAIRKLVDDARKMGCRKWAISGGEAMLRPDFSEIFSYVIARCDTYFLNTNGTLITPKIARLMKRPGSKMISLYGATAKVHDHITRNPGSFEATMRGVSYLQEEGASFFVQVVPMKDNFHQYKAMVKLAGSLSRFYRVGASWLYLSATGDTQKNKEIMAQRLSPKEVVRLDPPDLPFTEALAKNETAYACTPMTRGYFFKSCIRTKNEFHVDPYGGMTFCSFVKEPSFRYDLRNGSFRDGWERFIPSLEKRAKVTKKFSKTCGACKLREDCGRCAVYGYLERRDFQAKVGYLCKIARERNRFKSEWRKKFRKYFQIAGFTLQIDSDMPFAANTLQRKFKSFEVEKPREDNILVRHRYCIPAPERFSESFSERFDGETVFQNKAFRIFRNKKTWIYVYSFPYAQPKKIDCVAFFNANHAKATIYHADAKDFEKGNLGKLTFFEGDDLLLANLLSDRKGFLIHASGVDLRGEGLLFVGPSGAGKSTIAKMLKGKAKLLCDDRIAVRRMKDGFRIFGTWRHGEIHEVDSASAPLKGVFFLHKSKENRLEPVRNKKALIRKLLSCVIKPFTTAAWWEKTLVTLDGLFDNVPFYELFFNREEDIASFLKKGGGSRA